MSALVRANMQAMPNVSTTLKALAASRRSVPLALFGVMCVAAEIWHARSLAAGLFTGVLYTAFVVLGPLSWCVFGHLPFGRIVHGLHGLLCTYVFGVLLRNAWLTESTLLTDPTGLVAITGGFWVGGHSVGRDIQLESALDRSEAERVRAQQQAEHAQMLALRANLDPHFLFNTLNAIAEWCREAPEVAEQATLRLSEMLRAILAAVRHPTWQLERELSLVENLFALYQARDAGRFVFHTQVDEAVRAAQVPPLLLLTLAENAIKHGPAQGHRGVVELEARLRSQALHLTVRNPGQVREPRVDGEGLRVLTRRVAQLPGGGASFRMRGEAGITIAELTLPLSLEHPHG